MKFERKAVPSEPGAQGLRPFVPRFGLLTLLAVVTAVAINSAATRHYGVALWGLAAIFLTLSALPVGIATVLLARSRASRHRALPFLAFAILICLAAALGMLIIGELLDAARPPGQTSPPDDKRSLGR